MKIKISTPTPNMATIIMSKGSIAFLQLRNKVNSILFLLLLVKIFLVCYSPACILKTILLIWGNWVAQYKHLTLISAQVMISQFPGSSPMWALHNGHLEPAWDSPSLSLYPLSLSFCPLLTCTFSVSLKINLKKKNTFSLLLLYLIVSLYQRCCSDFSNYSYQYGDFYTGDTVI